METFKMNITPFNQERSIRVYLPYGYMEGTQRYPVLYMHDGQTVFQDEDVTDGISLRLKEYLDNKQAEVIIVGIDSNTVGNERVNEYSPWVNVEFSISYLNDNTLLGGKAEEYLEFIIHELLPLINNKYRTQSDCSYMAGCSLGGLFSTYAACRYPEVFTKVAALSSSFWFNQKEIEDLIISTNFDSINRFYLDCGTEEGTDEQSKSDFVQSQRAIYQILRDKIRNIRFNIVDGAGHNLLAFRERIPDVLSFFNLIEVDSEEHFNSTDSAGQTPTTQQQLGLDRIVHLFKDELSESLIGIYLHGSLAMGCFNPFQSDIDLLIIVKDKHSVETYKRIVRELLQIEEEMKVMKGIELSVVLESHVVDFIFPTPFEFHYSAFHKEKYKIVRIIFVAVMKIPT